MLLFYCTLDVRATLNIAFGASFDRLWYPIVGSIHFSQAVLHIRSVPMHSVFNQCVPFPLHCYRMCVPWITLLAEQ